jgi:2-phospho-L-lactate/phosphoenolpyruvate guanylyltransferase
MRNPAVLVPVKAFRAAKLRLAPALDPPARAELARVMASRVIEAASPLPVSVVCDDDTVAEWAAAMGAEVIWRPGRGLNGAVADGVAALAAVGHDFVIVAHGDLPHAVDLAWIAEFDGITLVPDRRNDGTNVVGLPGRAHGSFRFAYGSGSFTRHRAEAERIGIHVRVVREPRLGWDVDVPADLAEPSWPTP